MHRVILVLGLLFLAACDTNPDGGGAPPAAGEKEAPHAAAPGSGQAADAKGRTPFVHCIDLIREQRWADALPVCKEAEKSNPNDPQIKKAIAMAESGGEGAE